jgi:hypothetical protein
MLIQYDGCKYHGAADGDYGVFTDPNDGTVFAGSHANGSARVGVGTATNGSTHFVECDADGKEHGRVLVCLADGYTGCFLYEHGNSKEQAALYADGTCMYNGEDCSADFPPFAELKAKVLPIKARLTTPSPQPPNAAFAPPTPSPSPPSPPIGHVWHSQDLASTHAEKVRARRLRRPPWPRDATHHGRNAPHVQPGRRIGRRVHNMRSVPFRRPVSAVHAQ